MAIKICQIERLLKAQNNNTASIVESTQACEELLFTIAKQNEDKIAAIHNLNERQANETNEIRELKKRQAKKNMIFWSISSVLHLIAIGIALIAATHHPEETKGLIETLRGMVGL